MGRPKEFKVKKFDTNKNKIVIEEERKDKNGYYLKIERC